MKTIPVPTYSVTIYIAGELADVKRSLRRQCFEDALCVSVFACDFIYTAGAESGVAVRLVNYPRFPKTPEEILERAERVATQLITDLYQNSALVEAPHVTKWLTRRPDALEAHP